MNIFRIAIRKMSQAAETRLRNYITEHNLMGMINTRPTTNGIHLNAQRIEFAEYLTSIGSWICTTGIKFPKRLSLGIFQV